jgi:hypothetical protein
MPPHDTSIVLRVFYDIPAITGTKRPPSPKRGKSAPLALAQELLHSVLLGDGFDLSVESFLLVLTIMSRGWENFALHYAD